MANMKEHAWIGAGAGVLTYITMCRYYERPLDLGEMLGCALMSTAAAMVPDILEPALNPHHRNFAHSVVTGSALARFATDRCRVDNRDWEEFQKILWASATAGYLSHLVADACTPRGLPLLCR
jgi:inner membrane protein